MGLAEISDSVEAYTNQSSKQKYIAHLNSDSTTAFLGKPNLAIMRKAPTYVLLVFSALASTANGYSEEGVFGQQNASDAAKDSTSSAPLSVLKCYQSQQDLWKEPRDEDLKDCPAHSKTCYWGLNYPGKKNIISRGCGDEYQERCRRVRKQTVLKSNFISILFNFENDTEFDTSTCEHSPDNPNWIQCCCYGHGCNEQRPNVPATNLAPRPSPPP